MFMTVTVPELIPLEFYVPTEDGGKDRPVWRPVKIEATYRTYGGFNDTTVSFTNERGEKESHDSYNDELDLYNGFVNFHFYGSEYQVTVCEEYNEEEDSYEYSYTISKLAPEN